MAVVELIYDVKPYSYITSNPTKILSNGEPIYLSDGRYGFGDGITTLSSLPLYGGSGYAFTGLTSQYTRGDGTYATFPTNVSSFTNDSGYITSSALSPYLTIANAALTYQPIGSYLTGLTVGSTAIGSGTNTRILYNNGGVLGEYLVTGTGTTVVLSNSPTFTTDIKTPLIIGGSAVGSTIQYKGTTGVGTSTVAAHQFLVGNNGATTAAQIFNSGQVSIGNYASPTNLRILTIGQDTAYMSFGSLVGATSQWAIYGNVATPSVSNYTLRGDGTNAVINAPNSAGSVYIALGGGALYQYSAGNFIFTPNATTGAQTNFTFNASTNTSQTASTEISNFKVNGASKTWAAGAITNQRWNYFTANTAAFASASTITNSYGLFVEAATAGTNATITNNWSLGTNGNLLCQGSLVSSSPSGGVGYFVGAGSTVTQITSRTTGVTINNVCGAITLVSAAGTTTWQSFTVTNSSVTATDVIIVNQGTGTNLYQIFVTNVAAGSFQITFATTGGTTTEQPVFNFSIIKAVTT